MIAVIADDFTGAAEIGGIALKYGLKVLIETAVNTTADADVLIIATDTRSLPVNEATKIMEEITAKLIQLNPAYIYKKLDSVLRGNIVQELQAQMLVSGKKRALVVAGNPFFGRIIKNGIYTINSVPLAETHFANDPDFPINSSSVVDILNTENSTVVSKSINDELPDNGIIVCDITNQIDMLNWSSKINKTTTVAGGSGFFDILMANEFSKNPYPVNGEIKTGEKTLFVFGSTFPKTEEIIARFKNAGVLCKNMPEEIYVQKNYEQHFFDTWVNEVIEGLKQNKKVIVTVKYNYSSEEKLAFRIKEIVSELVKKVMQEIELNDLFIEGGATTSEILRALNISKLYPVKEFDFGIIQMKVDEYKDLLITTKPGSYSWPRNIFFEHKSIVNRVI